MADNDTTTTVTDTEPTTESKGPETELEVNDCVEVEKDQPAPAVEESPPPADDQKQKTDEEDAKETAAPPKPVEPEQVPLPPVEPPQQTPRRSVEMMAQPTPASPQKEKEKEKEKENEKEAAEKQQKKAEQQRAVEESMRRSVADHALALTEDARRHDRGIALERSAATQKAVATALTGRLQGSASLLGAVCGTLTAKSRAAEAYAMAAVAFPSPSPSSASSSSPVQSVVPSQTPSLDAGLEYLRRVGRTEYESFTALSQAARDGARDIGALQTEAAAELKRITAVNLKLGKAIDAVLESAAAAGRAYIQRLADAQRQQAAAEAAVSDPWIFQAKYYASVAAAKRAEDEFETHLRATAATVEAIEVRGAAAVAGVAQRFLAQHNNALAKVATDIGIASKMFATANPLNDWQSYMKASGLAAYLADTRDGTSAADPRSVSGDDVNPRDGGVRDSPSVVRCGDVERGGMLTWHKFTAVLTRFGFLHLFTTPTIEGDPFESIALARCRIDVSATAKNSFQIAVPTAGSFFGSGIVVHLIRVPNPQDMVAWLIDLRKFIVDR